jgi:3-hydroxybutyryl-CoA dehydrogenase
MPAEIKSIGVLGSGTMGSGIAQLAASAGFDTILYDVSADMLAKAEAIISSNLAGAVDRGKLTAEEADAVGARISTTEQLEEVRADLIIEAVVEDLKVKQKLFQLLSVFNAEDAIFASNTSTIPITRIASDVRNPERVAGMHFFNPAHIMKLVEVIAGAATTEETMQSLITVSKRMGKTPARAKDSPGFIVNRVARPYYVEALHALEGRVADHAAIDALMESSGFKMGPFRLMDLIGVDANLNVTKSLYESFWHEPRFRPSRTQQLMVEAGLHGRKSGRGFYTYD